jgi:6-phosphogluconolactonase (cycloisomerase 2 family)
VEAYAIDVVTGRLDFLNRRPLSLSATSPRHLAISPDGKMLAVAARAGGIYNLLSIESDGSLGSINALRKDVGCGPHAKYQSAAYPHSVAFHPGGHLVATDLGCDRVSSFAYADCRLIRKSNISAIAGAGPGALALHPSGLALYVNHELRPVISCHRFRPDSGEIEKPFQIVATPHPGRPAESALAIGSRGDFLYSARTTERSVTAWTIDPISGEISQHDVFRDALFSPRVLLLALARLYVLHRDCGAIMQLSIDPASGKFQDVACVAYTSAPRAIALLAH